jgi:hypothetical protein
MADILPPVLQSDTFEIQRQKINGLSNKVSADITTAINSLSSQLSGDIAKCVWIGLFNIDGNGNYPSLTKYAGSINISYVGDVTGAKYKFSHPFGNTMYFITATCNESNGRMIKISGTTLNADYFYVSTGDDSSANHCGFYLQVWKY